MELSDDYRIVCTAMISIATVISISTMFGYNHTLQTVGLVVIAALAGLSVNPKIPDKVEKNGT